jgi:maleate cis-trans isomerase
LLPESYQAHFGRLLTSAANHSPFAPSRDEDIDYQSRLLGTARVELVILIQTSASLHSDGYDETITERMSTQAGGVPAITSARAIGQALQALKARRIGLVSPYTETVNQRAVRYFDLNFGIETVAVEGFAATDSYEIGQIGPERAREAFVRIDRPDIDAFVVPGGNFPTMTSIQAWELEVGKPVVTTNQASFWAMLASLSPDEHLPNFGRLLAHTDS